MKIRPLLITICSFFLLQTAFSQDLRQDLLLYYPLDGNAKDYSGRNYDGDDHAIPTTDRTNTPNMAMEFNGSDTYIDLPFNFDLKPTFPFAIAFWVYFEEGATFIMTTDYAQDNHTGAWFNRILASKKFSFSVGDATGNTSPNQRFTFDTDYVMEDKTWYHVAVNWLDLHDAQVYINAFERETFTSGGAVGLGYTNNPGTIGRKDGNVLDDPFYFKGKVDEYYMWNRALTQEEVDILFYGNGLSNTDDISVNACGFTLSPNPTDYELTISQNNDVKISSVSIFDLAGKLVAEHNLDGTSSFNVSALGAGTYVAKLVGENSKGKSFYSIEKFVKS